ncbi:helix-turn-helix domain-containing GNAT family N-acetyltransferase [Epibacterium sp. DP7N7-1]|nr:helix-turn-helix domain-containing GNAT family N-acetyltransferase [Epibacterium sp. DP7N7-1]
MNQPSDTSRIDKMRAAARHIVRELGFMQKGLAGTDLSPSAVHTILEIGYGTVETASALGPLLHLEKSSVSRLLQKLESAQLIEGICDTADRRSRRLSLTPKGRDLLRELEHFGRQQFRTALDRTSAKEAQTIEAGLSLLADALRASGAQKQPIVQEVRWHQGYSPGVIGTVSALHAAYYAQNYGFGAVFERKVASEMSEFMSRIESSANTVFCAYRGEELLASVSLDGQDLEDGTCHLRWFIVSPKAQGLGIGGRLMERAVNFVDTQGYRITRLWTFRGLDAARHLYEKHGFCLTREAPGAQWGTEVIEQEFERTRA